MIFLHKVNNILEHNYDKENHVESKLEESKILLALKISENFGYINKMLPLHIPETFVCMDIK